MKPFYLLFVLPIFFIAGCSTQVSEYFYGPRWSDYAEWKNLKLGMTKSDVLKTLGEPYMTQAGYSSASSNVEVLTFKLRVKYYQLRKLSYKKDKMISSEFSEKGSPTYQDFKPEKFADTDVWGEFYTLSCEFSNDVLVSWSCPELQAQHNVITDTLITH